MEVDDVPDVAVGQELDDNEHSGEDSEASEFDEEDDKLITQLEEQMAKSPLSYRLHLQVRCIHFLLSKGACVKYAIM